MPEDANDPPLTYATLDEIAAELQARCSTFVLLAVPKSDDGAHVFYYTGDPAAIYEMLGEGVVSWTKRVWKD